MTQQILVDGIRAAVQSLTIDHLTPGQIDEVRRALRKTLVDAGIDAAPRFVTAAEQSSDGREYVLFKVWSYATREDYQQFVLPYTEEMKAYLDSPTRRKPRAALVRQIVEFNLGVDEFYREDAPQRVDAEQVEYILDMNNVGVRFNSNPEYLRQMKIAALALLGANAGDVFGPFDHRAAVARVLGLGSDRVGIAEMFEFNVDEIGVPDYFGYARWYEAYIAETEGDGEDDDDETATASNGMPFHGDLPTWLHENMR